MKQKIEKYKPSKIPNSKPLLSKSNAKKELKILRKNAQIGDITSPIGDKWNAQL